MALQKKYVFATVSTVCLGMLVLTAASGARAARVDPMSGGQQLYENNCGFCHGVAGSGGIVGKPVAGARPPSILFAIRRFVPGMAFLNGVLTSQEIVAISNYLNALPVTPEERYQVTCSGCHGPDARMPNRSGEAVVHESAHDIQEAIDDEEAMEFLRSLSFSDIQEIAAYLATL